MPPQLSESWASAYLQVLIGLFVFALGIPALMFQMVVQEGLRHVAGRYITDIWWRVSFISLVLSCLSFIWFLQPKAGGEVSECKRWIAGGILTIVPLLVGLTGFRLLNSYKRENIISKVKAALIDEWMTNGSFEPRTLSDFVYLGKHSEAGHPKEVMLRAFKDVAEAVQCSAVYGGRELKDLIMSLFDILKCEETLGDDDNFYAAAEILASILARYSEKPRRASQDADSIRITLTELGLDAIQTKTDRTTLKLLTVGASSSGDIVLRMGISAFSRGRFLIATNALNILEADVDRESQDEQGNLMPSDATSRLLGLVSHFVASGETAQSRGRKFFETDGLESYSQLTECLTQSLQYHSSRTDFETADKVAALFQRSQKRTWPVAAPRTL
jgi:hypothetical protein